MTSSCCHWTYTFISAMLSMKQSNSRAGDWFATPWLHCSLLHVTAREWQSSLPPYNWTVCYTWCSWQTRIHSVTAEGRSHRWYNTAYYGKLLCNKIYSVYTAYCFCCNTTASTAVVHSGNKHMKANGGHGCTVNMKFWLNPWFSPVNEISTFHKTVRLVTKSDNSGSG